MYALLKIIGKMKNFEIFLHQSQHLFIPLPVKFLKCLVSALPTVLTFGAVMEGNAAPEGLSLCEDRQCWQCVLSERAQVCCD